MPDDQQQPCELCIAGGYAEFCSSEHTATVVRLAQALAASFGGPPDEAKPEWYTQDAVAIAGVIAQGDGWVVEPAADGMLAADDGFFKVNATEFWFDWNGEGMCEPILGSERRAELEAEADDDA